MGNYAPLCQGSFEGICAAYRELESKLAAAEGDAGRYLTALIAISDQLSETEGCGEIDVLMGMVARNAIDAAILAQEKTPPS